MLYEADIQLNRITKLEDKRMRSYVKDVNEYFAIIQNV